MYAWIFRHLPGPLWLKIVQSLLVVAVALFLMVQFLFPWMVQFTTFTDSTIGSSQRP